MAIATTYFGCMSVRLKRGLLHMCAARAFGGENRPAFGNDIREDRLESKHAEHLTKGIDHIEQARRNSLQFGRRELHGLAVVRRGEQTHGECHPCHKHGGACDAGRLQL